MAALRELIADCPVCGEQMAVQSLTCRGCGSELRGQFSLPRLARLPRDLQDVVEVFLRCRGNIKDVERELGISYPTVSKKLDTINVLLASMGSEDATRVRILRQLEAGELSVAEAVEQLRKHASPQAKEMA